MDLFVTHGAVFARAEDARRDAGHVNHDTSCPVGKASVHQGAAIAGNVIRFNDSPSGLRTCSRGPTVREACADLEGDASISGISAGR